MPDIINATFERAMQLERISSDVRFLLQEAYEGYAALTPMQAARLLVDVDRIAGELKCAYERAAGDVATAPSPSESLAPPLPSPNEWFEGPP